VRPEFTELRVVTLRGETLSVVPDERDDAGDAQVLRLRLDRSGYEPLSAVIRIVPLHESLPPFIQPVEGNLFVDTRDGEEIDADEISARYGIRVQTPEPPAWFELDRWRTDFIETRRLDVLQHPTRPVYRGRRRPRRAPIYDYLDAVSEELERARFESSRIRQVADRTLASRLLTRAGRATVNVEHLRERYAAVERRTLDLTSNGLLNESLDVLPRENMNPTEKRVLSLFLDDFESKLAPLAPISARVDMLRAILERKYLNKHVVVDPREGVMFRVEPTDSVLAAEYLSSGEQHELALICRLLFNEHQGTFVLLDEPELSLHVSWQHEMVADLEEIASLTSVSVLMATHSTAIINGRWDLVEQLGPIDTATS
jgi:hypothetical protein